jgi:hypothetical protein
MLSAVDETGSKNNWLLISPILWVANKELSLMSDPVSIVSVVINMKSIVLLSPA